MATKRGHRSPCNRVKIISHRGGWDAIVFQKFRSQHWMAGSTLPWHFPISQEDWKAKKNSRKFVTTSSDYTQFFFYLSYASWLGSKEQGTCVKGWQKDPEITRALIRIRNIQVVAGRSNRYARRVSVSKTHRSDRFTYAIGLIKRIRKGRCLARSITSSNDIREFLLRIETCN